MCVAAEPAGVDTGRAGLGAQPVCASTKPARRAAAPTGVRAQLSRDAPEPARATAKPSPVATKPARVAGGLARDATEAAPWAAKAPRGAAEPTSGAAEQGGYPNWPACVAAKLSAGEVERVDGRASRITRGEKRPRPRPPPELSRTATAARKLPESRGGSLARDGDARRLVAALAPAYLPRRPTETVLYGLVRQHLESFLAHAREHYDGGLPRYVEQELRAYLKCGLSRRASRGLTATRAATICSSPSRATAEASARAAAAGAWPTAPRTSSIESCPMCPCGSTSCRCPTSCAGSPRSRPTCSRRSGASSSRRSSRATARAPSATGSTDAQCGSINFVQRVGSLNLNVHFHVAGPRRRVHPRRGRGRALPPGCCSHARGAGRDRAARAATRSLAWLRRRGYLDERPLEERSNEPPAQTALDACAAIAMGRGQVATLAERRQRRRRRRRGSRGSARQACAVARRQGRLQPACGRAHRGGRRPRARTARAIRLRVRRSRSNGCAGCRAGGSPTASSTSAAGGASTAIMTAMEFMARLAAIIAPPRYPLVRYAGVLGPRSAWRKDVVPKPRERPPAATASLVVRRTPSRRNPRAGRRRATAHARPERPRDAAGPTRAGRAAVRRSSMQPRPTSPSVAARPGDVIALAPNVLSVRHWDRLHRRRALRGHSEAGLGDALLQKIVRRGRAASAPSATVGFACSPSSPSASPSSASSPTSVCPPKPRRSPERATQPTTWTTPSPQGQLTLGLA